MQVKDSRWAHLFKGRMVCDVESARFNVWSIREPDTNENEHADQRTHDAEEEQRYVVW